MATSSASCTVRLTPLRTRSGSAAVRYSFSTPWATRSGTVPSPLYRAPARDGIRPSTRSLVPEHVDGMEARGLARRVERREERQHQRRDRDQNQLRRVHLHRKLGELIHVPRNLDDVVAVLDEPDDHAEDGADGGPDQADQDPLRDEDQRDAPRGGAEG